jgi:signal peptidase II
MANFAGRLIKEGHCKHGGKSYRHQQRQDTLGEQFWSSISLLTKTNPLQHETLMKLWQRLTMISMVSLTCIGCDQSTKSMATQYLPKNTMDSYFYDFLRLGYTENVGAFLGLGSQLPEQTRFIVFTLVVGLFLLAFLIYLIFNQQINSLSLLSLSLMFVGGSSNFYDRAINNGAVVDFLNIGMGPLRTGVFNVADMAILGGCFVYFLAQGVGGNAKK